MGNCFAPEKGGPEPDAEPAFARIERLERAAADAMPPAEEGVPVSAAPLPMHGLLLVSAQLCARDLPVSEAQRQDSGEARGLRVRLGRV